ncbi:hypothetical protein G7K_0241-t1 [Saitoella complicata NRRL Y-17804]|uniref:Uncharacterized protein n=1 Tax=Saitoella complicata (strain BCRC 22490 / CBS 7301 / JCM 7358 / NBRC 10748 / NRRL Y-17804) TaxID=698492 RepID=A0A0E9N8H3_SAICN|nr:hypothetical protein G7K_0241-t1 [Saitoella complicata NRRL Y-17804]
MHRLHRRRAPSDLMVPYPCRCSKERPKRTRAGEPSARCSVTTNTKTTKTKNSSQVQRLDFELNDPAGSCWARVVDRPWSTPPVIDVYLNSNLIMASRNPHHSAGTVRRQLFRPQKAVAPTLNGNPAAMRLLFGNNQNRGASQDVFMQPQDDIIIYDSVYHSLDEQLPLPEEDFENEREEAQDAAQIKAIYTSGNEDKELGEAVREHLKEKVQKLLEEEADCVRIFPLSQHINSYSTNDGLVASTQHRRHAHLSHHRKQSKSHNSSPAPRFDHVMVSLSLHIRAIDGYGTRGVPQTGMNS